MIKPSDVDLCASFPPLVGTMGKTEAEIAAALIVRACQVHGDTWQPVSWATVCEVAKADAAAKREPTTSMFGNPFCWPDVYSLIGRGMAEWASERPQVVQFTQAGLNALAKGRAA